MDVNQDSLRNRQNQQHKQHRIQEHQEHQHEQEHQPHQQEQLPVRERKGVNNAMKEKRKSEVMIAAQSLDNEVQSVKNLKRISIGSMDMLMDPELEYRVSSSAGKQENRKSWTSGIPTRPAEEVENAQNRAAVRYTYPSRAAEGEPDESFESELSEISFDVTNSEYLEGLNPDDNSSIQESESDTSDIRGSQKSQVSSSGRSISGVGTLKRGASNVPLRKTSTSSDTSNGSNSSLTKNLLWVPASQHPNVKPENYLELVQDTLHNIKLEGNENGQTGNGMDTTATLVDHGANKENEDKSYYPRKNSSLVRRPSRLRKSYTEFDEEDDDYQDTSGFSKKRSSEDLENASNLTISSTNSSRAVSLRDITDELTKISNNAGLTDSDAITLARTLSMAGSFTSDEPDDIIENSRSAQGDDLHNYEEGGVVGKREEDTEFASNMLMKKGFVIPARSSLRRSKFNTYRVRSASEENLHENKNFSFGSSEQHVPSPGTSSSQTDYVPTASSRGERLANPRSSQDYHPEPARETPTEEDFARSVTHTKQQDHLSTPGDQQSHVSKSPSQFIGEDGSNLTSPSTISDFQDIYDHYRQSSVDWEKELKKEQDFGQQSDNYNKPMTTEVHVEPPASEESRDLEDSSADNLAISKEDSLSSTEGSTGSVLVRPEHGQYFESTMPQQYHPNQETTEQPVDSSFAAEQKKLEPIVSESYERPTSNTSGSNRQAQKRGGWAFFSMGAKDILGGEQMSDSNEDDVNVEGYQSEEYEPQQNTDFIKTSTRARTDYERIAADRSNHSKNRHSPIFTENNKREIMEEPKAELETEPKNEEVATDMDEPTEMNSDYSNSDSSNSFSAQKLEKKFVNLFKRKGKNKSSSNKTGKTHKKLELTKKATNNTLPKFRKAVKGQSKHTDFFENEKNNDALSDGASPDISLGEPVDDSVMDTSADSFQDASENKQEEHLSLQPAVSVQSTKSHPGTVVESAKQFESSVSQEPVADNVVAADTEKESTEIRKQASRGKIQQAQQAQQAQQQQQEQLAQHQQHQEKQQQQKQQVSSAQQVQPTPPVQNFPQPLPPRKLTFSDVKRLDRPNAPMQFTDSAFGFPLPMLTVSTVIMFDHRLPINVERAIYRLSHLKLSDPKRELRQQVMLSNFMYAYLNLVNHTLYMEQVAQEGGQEIPASSKTTNAGKSAHTGSGPYTTDQNDANGAICIPDIQG